MARISSRQGKWSRSTTVTPTLKAYSALATEEEVQASIIEGLTAMGYVVLQTSHRRKLAQCPVCNTRFRPRGGYGATPGVPDLLVSREGWAPCAWLGLEVKGPTTKVSDEQRGLQSKQRIEIVRSWEEALEAVKAFEVWAGLGRELWR